MSINFDTSNETHQGPRTVRRDIWRLAIEISSIPSLRVFSKPNPESDRKSNGKPENEEWSEPKI